MDITLEKIDNLRERANVSYKEAKEALEKNEGNMIDAIIFLEGENKTVYDRAKRETERTRERHRTNVRRQQYTDNRNDFLDSCKKVLKSLNETRIVLYNSERVVLDISLTFVLIALLFIFPVVVGIVVLGLITGNRFKIIRKDKKTDILDKVLNKAAKVTQNVADSLKSKTEEKTEEKEKVDI